LSNRNRTLLVVLIIVLVMIASKYILPLPAIPPISLAPEALFRIGGFPFTNSLLMTLLVDVVLIGLVLLGVGRMQAVPRGLQNVLEIAVEALYNLGESIDRRNVRRFFTLAATIFFFVFLANLLALVPGVGSIGVCTTHEAALVNPEPEAAASEPQAEETAPTGPFGTPCAPSDAEGHELILVPLFRAPSADLNMTLSLALIVFVATQYFGFRDLGLGYLGKFFNIRAGAIGFFVGIVELLSEFVRIISFTFRLFGNIFAGEVVLLVMAFLVPWLLPSVFYGYELFVAFIQAFIFSILAMVFISLAVEAHGGGDHHDAHDEHEVVTTADSRQQALQ
jgi:F-type H+-transporting ATPase subunit a